MLQQKEDIINRLKQELLQMGGLKTAVGETKPQQGLEALRPYFPQGQFPLGAVHEFVNQGPEMAAATYAFICGLVATCLPTNSVLVCIAKQPLLYAAGLVSFNLVPHKLVFAQPQTERQTVWCIEEALRCASIGGVIAEMEHLNFATARRFQLAVEKTRVTGFILNAKPNASNITGCVSRWQISPAPSFQTQHQPGVGLPCWRVELQKMRHGKAGCWQMAWQNQRFCTLGPSRPLQALGHL
jgi:protein ImuA